MSSSAPSLLTVGHSNHPPQHFRGLLESHRAEVLVDVRSWPHSRYVEWADRAALPDLVRSAGARYLFLGEALGGRPDEDSCYDDEGHVLYGRVAETEGFRAGIARLRRGIDRWKLVAAVLLLP